VVDFHNQLRYRLLDTGRPAHREDSGGVVIGTSTASSAVVTGLIMR
jgi:hypothetical protein